MQYINNSWHFPCINLCDHIDMFEGWLDSPRCLWLSWHTLGGRVLNQQWWSDTTVTSRRIIVRERLRCTRDWLSGCHLWAETMTHTHEQEAAGTHFLLPSSSVFSRGFLLSAAAHSETCPSVTHTRTDSSLLCSSTAHVLVVRTKLTSGCVNSLETLLKWGLWCCFSSAVCQRGSPWLDHLHLLTDHTKLTLASAFIMSLYAVLHQTPYTVKPVTGNRCVTLSCV